MLVHEAWLSYFDDIDAAYYVVLGRLLGSVCQRFLTNLLLLQLYHLCFVRLGSRGVARECAIVFTDSNGFLIGMGMTIPCLLLSRDCLAQIKELDFLYGSRGRDWAIACDSCA